MADGSIEEIKVENTLDYKLGKFAYVVAKEVLAINASILKIEEGYRATGSPAAFFRDCYETSAGMLNTFIRPETADGMYTWTPKLDTADMTASGPSVLMEYEMPNDYGEES